MRVYLDHNAGAPLVPEARAAMLEVLDGPPGNASSAHREGARARRLLDEARTAVAALIGAAPREIVFTSGATEANNLALRGVAAPTTLVTTAVEHASVLEPARALGARVAGVDGEGRVAVADVVGACGPDTTLASIGLANGEVGTVQPVAEIAAAVRDRGILVHTDAAQAAGRIPLDVRALGVDLLSLSSPKLGGPAGAGALWIRDGVRVRPLASGGPQERGMRPGTENLAGIAGFGAAARAAREQLAAAARRMAERTEQLWQAVLAAAPDAVRHGPAGGARLPNTLNVRIPGCAGESLLVLLDLAGIAVSLGSACAAGAAEPSHVLLAMGLDAEAARGGLRFSVGPQTTAADVDAVGAVLAGVVRQVRGAGGRQPDAAPVAIAAGAGAGPAAGRLPA